MEAMGLKPVEVERLNVRSLSQPPDTVRDQLEVQPVFQLKATMEELAWFSAMNPSS